MPGDLFTRGAGVSRAAVQRRPRATRSDSEAAVLFVAVWVAAPRVRCGQAMQCAAALQKDESPTCTARCANKFCRRLAQAVLASVLLAARADSYAGLSDAIDSYPPPYDGSVRTLTLREILVFRR